MGKRSRQTSEMGCVQATNSLTGKRCRKHEKQCSGHPELEVQGVSYHQNVEKVPNDLSADETSTSDVLPHHAKKQRYDDSRLTPSKIDMDNISVASLSSSIDIAALTESTEKSWHFPKWGVSKKCTFCDSNCPDSLKAQNSVNMRSSTVRKQNNQKMPSTSGVCAMAFANLLAMNALELSAPASDALLKNRKNAWVQLAGHPGSFAPAGPHTIWKKRMAKENNETVAYQDLMKDVIRDVVPRFYREVEYNGDFFIEMEDLLQHFQDPSIMDIKMGTRTFLESEVKNPIVRKDLYEKMIKLDPSEPTAEEHKIKAITKLRYMQFREKGSSTSTLGFRIEAIRNKRGEIEKMMGDLPNADLKRIKTKEEVTRIISKFLDGMEDVRLKLIERLYTIKQKFEVSPYFKTHEIIGSSLLIMYDHNSQASIWMIDFAKTLQVEEGITLNHYDPWKVGTHETGYLFGLMNLIQIFKDIDFSEGSEGQEKSTHIGTPGTEDST